MASKIVYADLDAWFADTLGGAGNGKGDRMGVGMGTGDWAWKNRFAIRLPRPAELDTIPLASMISDFDVYLRVSTDVFGKGSNPHFYLERGTTTFTEHSESRRNFVSTVGPATGEWPGPTRTSTDRGVYDGDPNNGAWIKVPMLAMGQWWHANPSVTALVLVGVADDEAATADRCVFYTRESNGSGPYAELKWNPNSPPNTPTDLTPTGDAVQASTTGTQLALSMRHTDPDGDAATQDAFEVYPDSSTDVSLGTPLKTQTTTATTANNALRSRTITGLPARTFVKWRGRFKDANAWGEWSLLQRVSTAYQPNIPAQPAVTPGTLQPDFFASLVSADTGDYITAAEVNVYQDPAQGQTITKWATGKQAIGGSPNRAQIAYGGTALVWGTQYRWRIRLWNRDDIASEYTGDLYFTQTEPTGPTIVPGDLNTKINTLTPTFTLTDPGAQSFDQHRMWFYSPTGALLFDTGVVSSASSTSKDVTAPAGIWDWGQEPLVAAAIRVTGNADMGPTSEQKRIHLNARPGSPYPLSALHASAQFVQRADGVWVVDDATPSVLLPFRDNDVTLGYADAPSRQEVEVRTLADSHFASSPYIATSSIAEEFVLPTLTAETTYKVRGRYDDNATVRSDWSDYILVKRSAAPTLSDVTPDDLDTVTDPTPTFAWTYSSSGGKAQAYYRLTAVVDGDPVYDSGLVAGTASSITIPAFVLPNNSTVEWVLEVWDTDGLSVTEERSFDTDFSAPDALTGLTVTADEEAKALLVEWDASSLDDAEFEAYYIYARTVGGELHLAKTITDKATTAYLYRGAPHNTEIEIRLSQTNGFAESDPVTEVGELEASGTWWLRPEPVELLHDKAGAFSGAAPTRKEEFSTIDAEDPTARRYKTVLTWESSGYEWRLQLFVPPDAIGLIDTLRADLRAGTVGILKEAKRAYYSQLRSVSDMTEVAGFWTVQIEGVETGPESGAF